VSDLQSHNIMYQDSPTISALPETLVINTGIE